jgi:hypothetical protein
MRCYNNINYKAPFNKAGRGRLVMPQMLDALCKELLAYAELY